MVEPSVRREEQKSSWRRVRDQRIFIFPMAFDPSSGSQLCSGRVRADLRPCWPEWEVSYELCWAGASNQNFIITHQTWEEPVRVGWGASFWEGFADWNWKQKMKELWCWWDKHCKFSRSLNFCTKRLCSCEKGRSWKCLGRLSCAIFCCLLYQAVHKKPTFNSSWGPDLPPWLKKPDASKAGEFSERAGQELLCFSSPFSLSCTGLSQ